MADQPRRPTNPFVADLAQFQAPEFAGAREAAKGIVVGSGGTLTDRNVGVVMNQFAQQAGPMPGQVMEMYMRTTQQAVQRSGMTYNELFQMGRVGGQVGAQLGFDPLIGAATAFQSAGFGQAYQRLAGQSSLTAAQARQLDQELRLSAANSPMANMLGAAMSMSEAGLFKGAGMANVGGQNVNLGALTGNDPTKRQEVLAQLARLSPAQFVDTMRQVGINPDTASQFLGAQQANKDQIARHDIQNIVRAHQGMEVRGMMAEEMGGAFTGALRHAGVNDPRARRAMSMNAGAAIQAELERLSSDPNARNMTPEERNKRLATAAQRALPGMDPAMVSQLTAGAVRSMEEKIRSDPNLQRFGDMAGLLNMNRGDIIGQGAANANAAEAAARQQMGKKDEAVRRAEAAQPKPPAGAPGGPGGPPAEDPKMAVERARRIEELREKLGTGGILGRMKEALMHGIAATPEGAGRLTEEQRELVRLQKQQTDAEKAQDKTKKEGAAPGGGAAPPGQQPIKITGTLTVRADGSALIDADGGVPVNE